uniref:Uncharacterized protein n=1 Tax=Alexandrium monilatum TaxID=311494 RepID=A0A7S4V4P1_9DINO
MGYGEMWIPSWSAPTPYVHDDAIDASRIDHGPAARASSSRARGAGASGGDPAGSSEEGEGFWPLGVGENEPVKWTGEDVARLRDSLPGYDIQGPGVVAVCSGESGLFGRHSRLLDVRRPVFRVEEAARMCDEMPGCTHFSVTVGPDYPMGYEPRHWLPLRADLCKGPLITVKENEGVNSFVGVRRRSAAHAPPARAAQDGEAFPDGPIENAQLPPAPLALSIARPLEAELRSGPPPAARRERCPARRVCGRRALRSSWSGRAFL